MKRILGVALACAAIAPVAAAQAPAAKQPEPKVDKRMYIAFSGGTVAASDYSYPVPYWGGPLDAEVDSGAEFGGAYGVRVADKVRLEVGLSYRSQELESRRTTPPPFNSVYTYKGELESLSLDTRVFYDFLASGPVRPYVGAGVGVAAIGLDDGIVDDYGSSLELEAMAGVTVHVSDVVALFIEARYSRLGPVRIEFEGNGYETDFDVSGVGGLAGVRFMF